MMKGDMENVVGWLVSGQLLVSLLVGQFVSRLVSQLVGQ